MYRKIFISFLGTSDYRPTIYYDLKSATKFPKSRYIQEATLSLLRKEFGGDDKILIFLTPEARKRNWLNDGHSGHESKEGLESRIKELDLRAKIEDIAIPEGHTPDEIWKIFSIVYEHILDHDQVYFDITHAFRSLPMLNMMIMQYSKFLKNIQVKGIYYGAYEAKTKDEKGEDLAPIWDMLAFSELQDWSIAAQNFMISGNLKEITKLIHQRNQPILEKTEGKDETAVQLRQLKDNLEHINSIISTNRGQSIVQSGRFQIILNQINSLEHNPQIIEPLKPLLAKIAQKLKPFNEQKALKWLTGVQWCREHGLVQQGITQLQEGIIQQFIVSHQELKLNVNNIHDRELVSSSFNILGRKIPETDWRINEDKAIVREILKTNELSHLTPTYMKLSAIRNDINHGGYTQSASAQDITNRFAHCVEEVESFYTPNSHNQ